MTSQQKYHLKKQLISGHIDQALTFLESIDTTPTRTENQHNSLFLWFSQIEQEAENAGITWDRLARHTHQLKVTKENLHDACKQLTKALWGINSTKKIKKIGHIDIIQQHFSDWFGKEGLTLPPFPSDENKPTTMSNIERAKKINYPTEEYKEPLL